MIEGFCTDFNNVYTVLKGAKIVSDFQEKHDAVIKFDGTIFFKAKEIQLNFSEELSNTVGSLGGLHTALNFLSLLGNRFRSYASALENISVNSLMLFITLSVSNDFR